MKIRNHNFANSKSLNEFFSQNPFQIISIETIAPTLIETGYVRAWYWERDTVTVYSPDHDQKYEREMKQIPTGEK